MGNTNTTEEIAVNAWKNYYYCQEMNGLEIRVLKMQELSDVDDNIKRFHLGNKNDSIAVRKLIFFGETGVGKTTLINSIINNMLGVNFEDNFRYSVCDLKNKNRLESESQTDYVTEYTFNYIDGMNRQYNYVFVDTPGFGDTRGIQIQEENTWHTINYIKKHPSKAAIVIQSSARRLTAQLKSALLEVRSLVRSGKIEAPLILATFATNNSTNCKHVFDALDLPYSDLYLFNNSALYSKNQGSNNCKIIWNITNKMINKLLDILGKDAESEVASNTATEKAVESGNIQAVKAYDSSRENAVNDSNSLLKKKANISVGGHSRDGPCNCPNTEIGNLPMATEKAVAAGNVQEVMAYVRSRENAVNNSNSQGETILHLVAKYKQISILKALLKCPDVRGGMHLNCRRQCGRTPLMVAAETGDKKFVGILIYETSKFTCNVDLNAATPNGKTAAKLARSNSNGDIDDIISIANEGNYTVMYKF